MCTTQLRFNYLVRGEMFVESIKKHIKNFKDPLPAHAL